MFRPTLSVQHCDVFPKVVARRVSSRSPTSPPSLPCPPLSQSDLFSTFPDLLCNCAQSILGTFPNPPPVCVVHLLYRLFQYPVPSILGHLYQSNWYLSRSRFSLWLLRFVEIDKDIALLAQQSGLCCAVLRMQRNGQVEDGRGKCEASELEKC